MKVRTALVQGQTIVNTYGFILSSTTLELNPSLSVRVLGTEVGGKVTNVVIMSVGKSGREDDFLLDSTTEERAMERYVDGVSQGYTLFFISHPKGFMIEGGSSGAGLSSFDFNDKCSYLTAGEELSLLLMTDDDEDTHSVRWNGGRHGLVKVGDELKLQPQKY